MRIPFSPLGKCNQTYEKEIRQALERVIQSGWYVLGAEKEAFEKEFSDYIGVDHVIGVGNGLDALKIILRAYRIMYHWKEEDEVIVPANTFIATILAIMESGLTPVLVEPDEQTFNIDPQRIEEKITDQTKAVLIVHLYGQNAFNDRIRRICKENNLILIEDAAQAHGSRYKNRKVGSLGDSAAFSFYPGKNLGAMGDAGAICTDDEEFAECCRALSNYGGSSKYNYPYKGFNSRMDELQAAVLRIKLKGLDKDNERRREIARIYRAEITNRKITLPVCHNEHSHVWHQFVIRVHERDKFIEHMKFQGVEVSVHYPVAPHRQEGYPELHSLDLPITEKLHAEVVSLPIHPLLDEKDLSRIVTALESY